MFYVKEIQTLKNSFALENEELCELFSSAIKEAITEKTDKVKIEYKFNELA